MIRVIRVFISLHFYNIGWQLPVITVTCTGGPPPAPFYITFFAEEVNNSKLYSFFKETASSCITTTQPEEGALKQQNELDLIFN